MVYRRTFVRIILASCLAFLASFNFSPAASAALLWDLPALNQPAPDFTLPTNTGNGEISLSDYRGKWVVVYFYPKDFTSGCTLEARLFQQDLPKYIERNTQILGISVDDVDSHAQFCDTEGLTFPLLADTNGKVSKAYGSWRVLLSVRHSFIIDPDGILREIYTDVKPATHSLDVLERLEELQQGENNV